MLACNDEGGNWSGRVARINVELGDDEWQFEAFDLDGPTLKQVPNRTLRIAGKFFLPYVGYQAWVGNWCWDQVACTPEHAQRLLNYLRSSQETWDLTGEEGPHLG